MIGEAFRKKWRKDIPANEVANFDLEFKVLIKKILKKKTTLTKKDVIGI